MPVTVRRSYKYHMCMHKYYRRNRRSAYYNHIQLSYSMKCCIRTLRHSYLEHAITTFYSYRIVELPKY